MKSKVISVVLVFLLISSFLSYASRSTRSTTALILNERPLAEPQIEKPPKDYMKRLSERGTEPLGLKESEDLNQLLEQPRIKWIIRSEQRHILN